jgi:very-short-patch-repair endonuclease
MLFFPKRGRRSKCKKPLKRAQKRMKARAKFKAHGDNQLKTYRRRFTDYQVTVHANVCRQQRLRNRTRAEMAFAEMLDRHQILYEVEKIFLNGDRFILADFYFKAHNLVIELDGSAHDAQKEYDAGRDAWLLRTYGLSSPWCKSRYVSGKSLRFEATSS